VHRTDATRPAELLWYWGCLYVQAATIGFAMSAWGEFAFIVATASREAGTLDSDTYGAIILAVLVSAIYSPLAVKLAVTQRRAHETARNEMFMQQGAADHPKDAAGHTLHKVYYIARVQTASKWGLMDSLMKCVHELLELDVVDFRVHNKGGSSCFELYLRDRKLWAPNTHVSIAPYSDQVRETDSSRRALRQLIASSQSTTTSTLRHSQLGAVAPAYPSSWPHAQCADVMGKCVASRGEHR
jgi:hypothetical protein